MAALAGKKADIYITAGAGTALTDEPMSDVSANIPGAAVRTAYAVTNNVKRYFDPSVAMVFQISLNSGGSWATVVPDFIDAGTIRFLVSQQAAPAAQFRVHSGNYLTYTRMGGGHEWAATPQVDLFDSTEFGAAARTRVAGIPGGQVSIKRWWLDDSQRSSLGNRSILVLYTDATAQPAAPRYQFYAFLKDAPHKTPVKGVQEEDLNYEIDGNVVYLSA